MDLEAVARRVGSAQRAASRVQAELTAIQDQVGLDEPLLTDEEAQRAARAQEIGVAANRIFDIISAGLVIKEAKWLSEQCILLAATATGLDEATAQEALRSLKRSGCVYQPNGPATLAPLRRTLETV